MEKTRDFNSINNQEIKDKFVQREVYTCFSYEMDNILGVNNEVYGNDLPTWEDVENLYLEICNECGKHFESCKCEDSESEGEYQDIYEWWIVSEYLYRKLKDKGQPVLEWGNNYYWGRCTSGQAISLDGVISEICEEMEILEGQKYDWSK